MRGIHHGGCGGFTTEDAGVFITEDTEDTEGTEGAEKVWLPPYGMG